MSNITASKLRSNHLHSLGLLQENGIGLRAMIEQLSYVQVDAVFTIPRSQDVVLHTRLDGYTERQIWHDFGKLGVFEGWAHAKCIIPQSHLPHYYGDMLDRRANTVWWQENLDKYRDWPLEVLKQIEEEGEVGVGDIEPPPGFPRASGWNSPSKRVLDYLERRGYILGIHSHDFRLRFDLIERRVNLLPDEVPDKMERYWSHINSTLDAVGVSPLHRLLQYKYNHHLFEFRNKRVRPRNLLVNAVREGQLKEVVVDGKRYYGRQQDFEKLDDLPATDTRLVHFLSPFDNALWSRESLLDQYNFDYKMEIYVPANKRVYGYYVMPILYGNNFVGRVDVKLDREKKTLRFIRWHWEDKFIRDRIFDEALGMAISRLSGFSGAEKVDLGNLKNKRSIRQIIVLK